ncbi:MAG: hypothetical protein AB7E81_23465 [Hyphomicrobiaceae bacterium]|jgi:hypothetical protein
MIRFIATAMRKAYEGVRIVVPTFAVAGLLLLCRTPDLWAMTDYNGNTNWLPFIVIACLSLTLIALLRAR